MEKEVSYWKGLKVEKGRSKHLRCVVETAIGVEKMRRRKGWKKTDQIKRESKKDYKSRGYWRFCKGVKKPSERLGEPKSWRKYDLSTPARFTSESDTQAYRSTLARARCSMNIERFSRVDFAVNWSGKGWGVSGISKIWNFTSRSRSWILDEMENFPLANAGSTRNCFKSHELISTKYFTQLFLSHSQITVTVFTQGSMESIKSQGTKKSDSRNIWRTRVTNWMSFLTCEIFFHLSTLIFFVHRKKLIIASILCVIFMIAEIVGEWKNVNIFVYFCGS